MGLPWLFIPGAIGASNLRSLKHSSPLTLDEISRREEMRDRLTLVGWVGVILGATAAFVSLMVVPPGQAQSSGGGVALIAGRTETTVSVSGR